jgi:hypothetical protein
MHPSGKFLFGSNRGHDSIVIFIVAHCFLIIWYEYASGRAAIGRRGLSIICDERSTRTSLSPPYMSTCTNLGTEGLKPVADFPGILLQGVCPRTTGRRMSGWQMFKLNAKPHMHADKQ